MTLFTDRRLTRLLTDPTGEELRNLAECVAEMNRDTARAEVATGRKMTVVEVAEWLEQEAEGGTA